VAEPDFDVAVVGGGPAGLSAAEASARGGLATVLFEKNQAIGVPVRTSGGSWIPHLRELGIPDSFWHPLHRIRVMTPRVSASLEYEEPLGCVLDVRSLYQFLAVRCASAGVDLRLHALVESPLLVDGRVVGVKTRKAADGRWIVTARVVIDAGGHRSPLRDSAKKEDGGILGLGVEDELYAPAYDQREAMLFVGNEVAPNGYGWAFPCGNQRVRVGVGVPRPMTDADPREHLRRLPALFPELAAGLEGSQAIEVHHGLVPLGPPARSLVDNGLIRVGDAARQASSIAGEGIRFAIHSGRMAGAAAVRVCRSPDTSARALGKYRRAWGRRFGADLRMAHRIHRRLLDRRDDEWDEVVRLIGRLGPGRSAGLLMSESGIAWCLAVVLERPDLLIPIVRFISRAPARSIPWLESDRRTGPG
jgi:digeranylgeranylglycerophospholipid reductase